MSYNFARFSPTQIREQLKMQGNKCVYCGQYMTSNSMTVEHFIPQIVAKYGGEKQLELVKDRRNLLIAHVYCNKNKNSRLPKMKDVNSLKCDKHIKRRLSELILSDKYAKTYSKYTSIVKRVLAKQYNGCACCNAPLDIMSATLRRRDNSKDRTFDNTIALCDKCNRTYTRQRESKECKLLA